MAQCPCHDDGRPSLKVQAGRKVDTVLKCYANCPSEEIFRLLEDYKKNGNGHGEGEEIKIVRTSKARDPKVPLTIEQYAAYLGVTLKTLTALPLEDREEGVAFMFEGRDHYKYRTNRQQKFGWTPRGSWGTRTPLWPMPEQTLPETIWVCEGETDAIVARHLGYHAYALTAGTNTKITDHHFRALKQRGAKRLVLCMDNDEAGIDARVRLTGLAQSVSFDVWHVALENLDQGDPFSDEPVKDLHELFIDTGDVDETLIEKAYDPAIHYEEFITRAEDDIPWVMPGLVAAGDKVGIIAPQKTLKTYFVLAMVHALASGTAFLGRPALKADNPVKCMIVEEEGNDIHFARRLTAIARGAGCDPKVAPVILFRQGIRLDEYGADYLIALVRKHGIEFLVLDPFQRMSPGIDENAARDQGILWDQVHRICSETGVACAIVHHARKDAGLEWDSIRGSSRFGGEVDCAIFLRKEEEGELTMSIDGRDITEGSTTGQGEIIRYAFDRHEHTFKMEATGFEVPIVKVKSSGSKPKKEDEILTYIAANPNGVTREDVAAEFEISGYQVGVYLRAMESEKRVTVEATGRTGKQKKYKAIANGE